MKRETIYKFDDGTTFRPVNADPENGGIGFKTDWTGDPREVEVNVDSLLIVGSAKKKVEAHIASFGFFAKMPITITFIEGNAQATQNYYIDLTDGFVRNTNSFEIRIKREKAIDDFFQQADAFSYELLNKQNPITNIFNIPYVIVKDQQTIELIALGLSTYALAKELIQAAKDVQTGIADLIQATVPVGIPPSPNFGAIIAASIKLAAQLIYTAAILFTLITLIQQVIEGIFQKVRNLKGSYVKELIKQGVEALGYNFSSSLLDSLDQLTLLPVPLIRESESIFDVLLNLQTQSYNKGYPTANDTTSTVGSLIRAVERWLNAKTRIVDGTVFIEDRQFWFNQSGVTVRNTLNLQDIREASFTYNFDEAWKRYYLHYRTDTSDINTLDKIEGIDTEYSTELDGVGVPLIKGLVDVDIPFALGKRKDKLNFVEKTALVLAEFADFVVNTLGGSSNLAGLIEGRIGVLQISQQYFRTTKMLWTVGGKQTNDYLSKIGADAIYQLRHTSNQVKENFKRIYTATVPFSSKQFVNSLVNNVFTDQTGEQLEVLMSDWINENSEATITYTIDSTEASNLKTIFVNG